MSAILSPWGVTAGAAVGSAVAGAVQKLAGSISFADMLQAESAVEQTASPQSADSLATLREQSHAQLNDLQTRIAEQLQAAGIQLEPPVQMEVDSFGDWRVDPEHADASRIELLLNSDPSLREQMSELQAVQTKLERQEIAQRAELLETLDPRAAKALLDRASQHEAAGLRLVVGT